MRTTAATAIFFHPLATYLLSLRNRTPAFFSYVPTENAPAILGASRIFDVIT